MRWRLSSCLRSLLSRRASLACFFQRLHLPFSCMVASKLRKTEREERERERESERERRERERERYERPEGGFPFAAAFLEELLCRTFFSHWKAVSS